MLICATGPRTFFEGSQRSCLRAEEPQGHAQMVLLNSVTFWRVMSTFKAWDYNSLITRYVTMYFQTP